MLAEKLKRLRESKNLQTTDIAKLLGISRQAYSRYETGQNEPNTKSLIKLADFYEVSVDYLLGRDEQKFVEDISRMSDNDLDKKLMQFFMDLPESSKQGIRDFMMSIASGLNIEDKTSQQLQKSVEEPNSQIVVEKPSPLIVQSESQRSSQPVQKLQTEPVQAPPQMVQNKVSEPPVMDKPEPVPYAARTFDGKNTKGVLYLNQADIDFLEANKIQPGEDTEL